MHARLNVESILFNIFLPHSNRLKYIGSLVTGLSVTKGSLCSVSLIAYFYLFMLILLLTLSELLSSVELSSTVTNYDSLSSVEQTSDKVFPTRISFDLLLYESQTCEIGICCVPVIYVLTWST